MKVWRHGDVQLTAIPAPPPNLAELRKLAVPIAAAGKATGHSHRFGIKHSDGVTVYETVDGKTRFVHVEKRRNIDHAEHRPFAKPLPHGWYRSDTKRQGHDEAWSDVED